MQAVRRCFLTYRTSIVHEAEALLKPLGFTIDWRLRGCVARGISARPVDVAANVIVRARRTFSK
jgi:hypothetical protein